MSRAQFFKDCKANQNMTLTLIDGANYEWIKEKRPQNLRPRKISKVQTNAVYLEGEENRGQGSYLELPQASLMVTGGVSLDNMQESFDKGATVLGAGGNLVGPAKTGNIDQVKKNAQAYRKQIDIIKSSK